MSAANLPEPGSHCSACGAAFAPDQPWPRRCAACGTVTYRNPLPVAVLVQPVRDGARVGVLVIRRTVEPQSGWLALPGGFIEYGESWQEACAREAFEEAALRVDPATITVRRVASTPRNLAVFGEGTLIDLADLPPFAPNDEASERLVLFAPTDLAFPLHSALLAQTLSDYGKPADKGTAAGGAAAA